MDNQFNELEDRPLDKNQNNLLEDISPYPDE